MVIEKDRVVTIDYKLRDAEGELIDSSEGSDPLVYLHGNENIVPGLEKHLLGKGEGDLVDCVIPAEEAYGIRDESLVFKVNKAEFGPEVAIEPGMQFEAHGQNGAQIVTVVGIAEDEVTIDANHPLAGEELHFHVEVKGVREATSEELEHGHVHGGCSCGCGDEECGDGECSEGGCGSGCGCGG
ncbi:MAG: peptidylprolyl isomerase [Spirochaetaceae bacterium]|nr:peptidylprolyl isomerase [Spirochaetaceae bacterium]